MPYILITLLLLCSIAFAPDESTLADWVRIFKATPAEIEEILQKGTLPDSLRGRMDVIKLNLDTPFAPNLNAFEVDRAERSIQDLLARPTASQRIARFDTQKKTKIAVLKPIVNQTETPANVPVLATASHLPELRKLLKGQKIGHALHDFIDHLDSKPHEGPAFDQTLKELGDYLNLELSKDTATLPALERLMIAEALTRLEFLSKADKKKSTATVNSWNSIHQFNKELYVKLLKEAQQPGSNFKHQDVVRIVSGRLKQVKTERDEKLGNILREGFKALALCKPPQTQRDFLKAILMGAPMLAFEKSKKAQGLADAVLALASEPGMNSKEMIKALIETLNFELQTLREMQRTQPKLETHLQDHLDLIQECQNTLLKSGKPTDALAMKLILLPKNASNEEIKAALTEPMEAIPSKLTKLKELWKEHREIFEAHPEFAARVVEATLPIGPESLFREEAQSVRDFYREVGSYFKQRASENRDAPVQAAAYERGFTRLGQGEATLTTALAGEQSPVILGSATNSNLSVVERSSSIPQACIDGASTLGRAQR